MSGSDSPSLTTTEIATTEATSVGDIDASGIGGDPLAIAEGSHPSLVAPSLDHVHLQPSKRVTIQCASVSEFHKLNTH